MATPTPQPNLAADLLTKLKAAKSPLARVRVVVSGWRAVRGLSHGERIQLAAQLGLDGADDLVEVIASHQGTAPPADLIAAVNEVQKIDPATMKSIVNRVRDPRQRAEGIRQGLRAVEDALAGPAAVPPPVPQGPPAGFQATWLPKGVAPEPPPPSPVSSPAPKPIAPATPPPPRQDVPPVVSRPATSWPLREAPPAPAAAVAPSPAAPATAAVPPPARSAYPPSTPTVFAPVPAQPEPARDPSASAPSGLGGQLAAVPALTSRFRHLRRHLHEMRPFSAAQLRGVLEVFPDGWPRRRALTELLEAGVPASTADALSLMDILTAPGDRAWCLGTLADRPSLTPGDRSALLQAAGTPAVRRRLGLRLENRE